MADELPYLVAIGEADEIRFKIVHAELQLPDHLLEQYWSADAELMALWSRNLHLQYQDFCATQSLEIPAEDEQGSAMTDFSVAGAEMVGQEMASFDALQLPDEDERHIPIAHGIGLMFCGQTSVKQPGLLRSHFLLDSGCGWWSGAPLTELDVRVAIDWYRHWQMRRPGDGDIYE